MANGVGFEPAGAIDFPFATANLDAFLQCMAAATTLAKSSVDSAFAAFEQPLKRARSRLLFDLETLRDSTPSIAYWFGLQHSFQGADTLERRVERVMGVTSTSLRTAAARHLSPSRMQLTIVGNISALDRAALRRRIHRIRSADASLRHV